MPARCIPEQPVFENSGEERAFKALRAQLPAEAVLLHSVWFMDRKRNDREADFIILWPGVGFIVIEVKAGEIWFENGAWWQRHPTGPGEIHPVEQARNAKYLMNEYLLNNAGIPRNVFKGHFVLFLDTADTARLRTPEILPELTLTKNDMNSLAYRIEYAMRNFTDDVGAIPDEEWVANAGKVLVGAFNFREKVAALRAANDDQVERLTRTEARALRAMREVRRFQVVGGPGSGKTWAALHQVKFLAEAGESVGLLCFNVGLREWLSKEVATWPTEVGERVTVENIHSLGRSWGVEIPEAPDTDFWDREFFQSFSAVIKERPIALKFDSLVIDEAQDFDPQWVRTLLGTLRDQEKGGLFVFGDEDQGVFGRDGELDLGLPRFLLDANVRNTRQIAEFVRSVVAKPMEAEGIDGPPVKFVQCGPEEDMEQIAEHEVFKFLDEGFDGGDVVLLTTKSQHHMQRDLKAREGADGYWDAFWSKDEHFYCTVGGFKGLDRPIVVLAVNGFHDEETARDFLYVGMSRARDQLVIVGDFDELAAVGGKEFAKRLTKARTES